MAKRVIDCPICQMPQHIVRESEKFIFLGCGHSIEKPEETGKAVEPKTKPPAKPKAESKAVEKTEKISTTA